MWKVHSPLPLLTLALVLSRHHLQHRSSRHTSTHAHMQPYTQCYVPCMPLKGNMMRLIDRRVVSSSRFVVAFSCSSQRTPTWTYSSVTHHFLWLLSLPQNIFLRLVYLRSSGRFLVSFIALREKTKIPASWYSINHKEAVSTSGRGKRRHFEN